MPEVELPIGIIEKAREDSPVGFELFYNLIHGMELPRHALAWIEAAYAAHAEGKGIVIEAFRGSTKTTTFATFLAFRLGHSPHKSNLVLQLSESSSKDWTELLTKIIEHNPAFQMVFPGVGPGSKWGAEGYDIINDNIDPGEWARLISNRKDPSYLGLGRTSRTVIGKHPTECLFIDDYDDETTTRSIREQSKTSALLTGTVFPAGNWCEWIVVVGTPWNEKDTIHQCLATGEFLHARTPIYTDGKPTWPEFFPEEKIRKERHKSGEIEFARMYLLDIEAAKGRILKKEWIGYFPASEIDDSWPEFGGIDYASTADRQRSGASFKDRDAFSVAWGRGTPQGSLIITDGWSGVVSQQESQMKVVGFVSQKPFLKSIGFESIGTGKDKDIDLANALLMEQRYVPIMPIHSHGNKSKGYRFEKVLALMFQQGKILLSDKLTPFLSAGVNQWVSWDGGNVQHDDVLDSWYMLFMAFVMHSGLSVPQIQMEPEFSQLYMGPKKKSQSPWISVGRANG